MRLLLVRHGESSAERPDRYWGHTDISLSPIGYKQAERLRDRLAEEEFSGVYSSDLQRALTTAQIIASVHQVDIIPCKELREINFGKFEGMSFEEIKKHFPEVVDLWMGKDIDISFPQGESLCNLENRVQRFLNEIIKQPLKTVLVVAHGGPLRVMLCKLLKIKLQYWWQIRLDHASLTVLETFQEGAIISLLNDICHLRSLERITTKARN